MRFPSPIRTLCCLGVLLATVASAFNVNVRTGRGREGQVFTSAYVDANGERFALVVPNGWQVRGGTKENTFSLNSPSGESPINVEFSAQDAQPVLASTATMRQAVVPFLQEATLLEEFAAHSGYGPGRGMDLSFTLQGHRLRSRVVVIPLARGFVNFYVACSAENQESILQVLGATLTSFRSAPANAREQITTPQEFLPSEAVERPKARLAVAAQEFTVLHTEPPPPASSAEPERKAIFADYEDHVRLGVVGILMAILLSYTVARDRCAAEVRALCGGYLSDGTAVASFKMPEWFAPPKFQPQPNGADTAHDWMAEKSPIPAEISLVEKFLEEAPEYLGNIRQALRALTRSGNEADWQAALTQLPKHFASLKDRANFWEMRPVWQMSSALELLAQRIAEKPKHATPSTLRTLSAAADLLQKLCAPGIRPNLIIDPPIKILAVDDDTLCMRALTFALQKANLVSDSADNGVKALALATEQAYDVIFMDIQMPEMDGLTACKRIHETEANADTPVVFVTIQSDFHTRAQSTVIGGSDLMAKPFLVFELAVKALTFAMRKRLQLQNSHLPGKQDATAPEIARMGIVTAMVEAGRIEPVEVSKGTATAEARPEADGTGYDFLDAAPGHLVAMRQVLEEVGLATDETKRQEHLGDLYLRSHRFATEAGMAGLPLAARVGSALEALLKKIYEKPERATASTRNTIATALDVLDDLRIPGRRQKLADDSPVHLLVVDDEPLARRAITGALQLAFDKPDSAADGTAALALATQKSYDVIFTDVQMPGLDGFELCAELRANGPNRTTPVVFITSQDDGDARAKAQQSGGSDFIAKPCLPSEITLKALTFVMRKRLQLPKRGSDDASFPESQPVLDGVPALASEAAAA